MPRPYSAARSAEGVGEGDRGVAARRRRRVHRVAGRRAERLAGRRARGRRRRDAACRFSRGTSPCCSGGSSASARTSRGRTSTRSRRAASRICSSAARRSTTARRSRRFARRWRPSSGRTTSCRCSRRCKGRSSRSTMSMLLEFRHRFGRSIRSAIPRELGGNSGQELALTGEPTTQLMPIADALRLLQQLHRRRNYRPVADTIGRLLAETRAHVGLHPSAGRRAGARERPARRRAGAPVRSGRRHLVPRVHRRAADRARARGRRGADSRREQRRRPADDRAQGQGPRVSGRHPRRPDVPAEPQRREPVSRSPSGPVRDEDRRLGAARAARSRSRGGGARSGRRRPPGVRRGDARARSARRSGARRRAVGGRLVRPAESRAVSADRRAAQPGRGAPRCPAFQSKDTVLQRPNEETAAPATVVPGAHRFADGGYSVVWWDPAGGGWISA